MTLKLNWGSHQWESCHLYRETDYLEEISMFKIVMYNISPKFIVPKVR